MILGACPYIPKPISRSPPKWTRPFWLVQKARSLDPPRTYPWKAIVQQLWKVIRNCWTLWVEYLPSRNEKTHGTTKQEVRNIIDSSSEFRREYVSSLQGSSRKLYGSSFLPVFVGAFASDQLPGRRVWVNASGSSVQVADGKCRRGDLWFEMVGFLGIWSAKNQGKHEHFVIKLWYIFV